MDIAPRVSVLMPFLNVREDFFREAVESVIAQTYDDWELLLVDDGSADENFALARSYEMRHPDRIRLLATTIPRHRGISAARNHGIQHARGSLLAILDADDVWLPEKLAEHVGLMDSWPEAGMVYSDMLIWHSWNPASGSKDHARGIGAVPLEQPIPAPRLLVALLCGTAAVPGTCSILAKRTAVMSVGGFESRFRGLYEDQAFYAKMMLEHEIVVVPGCWQKYRQHSGSVCAAGSLGERRAALLNYLRWLDEYVASRGKSQGDLKRALERALFFARRPRLKAALRITKQVFRRKL